MMEVKNQIVIGVQWRTEVMTLGFINDNLIESFIFVGVPCLSELKAEHGIKMAYTTGAFWGCIEKA